MNKKYMVVFSKKYFSYLRNVLIMILIFGLIINGCEQFMIIFTPLIGKIWSEIIIVTIVVLFILGVIVKEEVDYKEKKKFDL